ncbi:DUF4931 domain-containing protein [Patescibacteria group bacterium]|nr:DUF4931 domain-containing protein [Patescibacteria group bacterium]
MVKAEVRQHYFLDQLVIIAPRRGARPNEESREATDVVGAKDCPFCDPTLSKSNVIELYPQEGRWRMAVVENKFPAVTLDNESAYGKQEVVVETSEHNYDLAKFPVVDIQELLHVYISRVEKLRTIPGIQYISVFRNEGGKAGASLKHAHSQIFATDILPPELSLERQKAQEYYQKNGQCPYCQVISEEEKGPRLVFADEHIIAFTPYASRFNYEVWILPRRHLDNITFLSENELASLSKVLKLVLKGLDDLGFAYNYYLHDVTSDNNQHLYLKIAPRGSVWAGIELGSGLIINPVSPEEAAEFFRK